MNDFILKKAKAVLKKVTTQKKKSKEESKPVLANDMHLHVVVDDRAHKAVGRLFPGFDHNEKKIAGLEGNHPGMKMQTSCDIPEVNIKVYDSGGKEEVFAFDNIGLAGQPQLFINSLGDSHLFLRVNPRLTKKDMSRLVDYIEADVYISVEVAQPSLPGVNNDDGGPKNGKANGAKVIPIQKDIEGLTGAELREIRDGLEVNREEMVKLLAQHGVTISVRTLSRYERGERIPPPEVGNAAQQLQA